MRGSSPFRNVGGRRIWRLSGPIAQQYAVQSGGGGSSSGGSPAVVGSTIAALGAGSDGKIGLLRIGTWPDVEYVELVYDGSAGKWISKPEILVTQSDLGYMGEGAVSTGGTTTYDYVDTFTSGGADSIGWTTRPLRKAYDLLNAGLSLQALFTAVVIPASGPVVATFQMRFFANGDGNTITFSADGSIAAAELASPIVTPVGSGAVPYFVNKGWQNIVKLNTVNPVVAADVGSATPNLWPRLYGKVASGVTAGQIADADLQVRWVA